MSDTRVNEVMPFMYSHRYRLHLDTENSWWGYMSCRITGTYVGRSSQTLYEKVTHQWVIFGSTLIQTPDRVNLRRACFLQFCFALAPKQDITTWVTSSTLITEGDLRQTMIWFWEACHLTLEGWIVNIQDTYIISIHACIVSCRSLPDKNLFRISAGNKLSMFQTYAGMSPQFAWKFLNIIFLLMHLFSNLVGIIHNIYH